MNYILSIVIIILLGLLIYIFFGGPKLPPETDQIIDDVLNSELPEVVSGQTGFATSDGLRIWYESISPDRPPKGMVLLIMANGGDALIWPPKFLRAFVDADYQVIRYDHRGTGMSDWVENWDRKNPYSIADMAGDAVAVLDAAHVLMAHIIGLSMGGMVAQEVAINHPDRAASLTLMMTSGYVGDPDLPDITSRYFLDYIIKGIPLLKYRIMGGEENLIRERIAKQISVVGIEELDIKELAEVVLYDLRNRRGVNIQAIFQHQAAVSISGSRYDKLIMVNVPTLVIHGTADQFIPFEHGKKLAEIIPNAESLWLDGVGHVFPYPNMDSVTERIISHLDSSK